MKNPFFLSPRLFLQWWSIKTHMDSIAVSLPVTFICRWIHAAILRGAIMISWVFASPCNHINYNTIQSFRCLLFGHKQTNIRYRMLWGFKKHDSVLIFSNVITDELILSPPAYESWFHRSKLRSQIISLHFDFRSEVLGISVVYLSTLIHSGTILHVLDIFPCHTHSTI